MKTKKLIESLEKLAEKLGTTAEKLFGYYVKNAKMYRLYFVIELIVAIAALTTGIILVINFYPEKTDWFAKNIVWSAIGGISSILGLIGLFVTLGSVSQFINSWVNPEYEAIEDILGTLMQE